MRALTAGAALTASLLALAAPASAATNVSVLTGTLSINAGDVADTIQLSTNANGSIRLSVSDTFVAGTGCTRVSTHLIDCVGVTGIFVATHGGNDFVLNGTSLPTTAFMGGGTDTYLGGSNADIVSGGDLDDQLFGGPGNDQLTGNQGFDSANGGGGFDTCEAESSSLCEQ